MSLGWSPRVKIETDGLLQGSSLKIPEVDGGIELRGTTPLPALSERMWGEK